jgi:hypothetical protein
MARNTVGENLCWTYANLAMAHAAVEEFPEGKSYGRIHFMIRAKLYKGLISGSMKLGSILDDEREKMKNPSICIYCGGSDRLSVDHLVPKSSGGIDTGDNLILACRSCNSSKGKKDLLDWYRSKEKFPPLMLLRRYLKLANKFCSEHVLLDKDMGEIDRSTVPFALEYLPSKFPPPYMLCLTIKEVEQTPRVNVIG